MTGWTNGLLQDYDTGLGRWFADRLGAREQLRRTMMNAGVELTIRCGPYGSDVKSVAIDLPEDIARELMGTVEHSNDPFSLLLSSPGMYGGKGDAVTIRRETFKMRREYAELIAKAMVPELLKAFGVNDELDGYKISGMSDQEIAFQKSRGRI